MHTLPHQFELLSDSWLDEARSYLIREIAARRDELSGLRSNFIAGIKRLPVTVTVTVTVA